jgi:hypothetical protein
MLRKQLERMILRTVELIRKGASPHEIREYRKAELTKIRAEASKRKETALANLTKARDGIVAEHFPKLKSATEVLADNTTATIWADSRTSKELEELIRQAGNGTGENSVSELTLRATAGSLRKRGLSRQADEIAQILSLPKYRSPWILNPVFHGLEKAISTVNAIDIPGVYLEDDITNPRQENYAFIDERKDGSFSVKFSGGSARTEEDFVREVELKEGLKTPRDLNALVNRYMGGST